MTFSILKCKNYLHLSIKLQFSNRNTIYNKIRYMVGKMFSWSCLQALVSVIVNIEEIKNKWKTRLTWTNGHAYRLKFWKNCQKPLKKLMTSSVSNEYVLIVRKPSIASLAQRYDFGNQPEDHFKALVTRIPFHLKTQLYRCGFTSCWQVNDENHNENANTWIRNPKWNDLKTHPCNRVLRLRELRN